MLGTQGRIHRYHPWPQRGLISGARSSMQASAKPPAGSNTADTEESRHKCLHLRKSCKQEVIFVEQTGAFEKFI